MDWISKMQRQAQEAAEKLISSEAADKARQLAAQATQQAAAFAQQATIKAQVQHYCANSSNHVNMRHVGAERQTFVFFAGSGKGGHRRSRKKHHCIEAPGVCQSFSPRSWFVQGHALLLPNSSS